jgi:uracil-DNA glycosylase
MKGSTVQLEPRLDAADGEPASAERELWRVPALAAGCRACELWERATQTVFGRGPVTRR